MADDNRYRDDDRSRNRSEDRTRSGGYGREGYRSGERDFGDRASDEVRSWLGDDDAERRRGEDERRGGGGYGPDYGSGSRSSSGDDNRGDYGRGSYGGDDNRSYGQGGSGYRRGSYGSQGEYGSYGRQGYGDQDRGVTGYRGERGFWDRASDEVSSWFGSDEAARRREQDARQGDQGAQHHRGRGPKGYTRSDERIREDVCDRLTDDPRVDASEIEVTVTNREVALSGTVDSREAKRRAEDIAESVGGVTHVQNNLRVGQGLSGGTGGATGTGTTTGVSTGGGGTVSTGRVGAGTTTDTTTGADRTMETGTERTMGEIP
jgi:osmotically-inducible protein OsmY